MDYSMDIDMSMDMGTSAPSLASGSTSSNLNPSLVQFQNPHPPTGHEPTSSLPYPAPTEDTTMSSEPGPSQMPFYPSKRIPGPPHLRMRLHPSQDLLSRLGMMPAYNELVRPYTRVPETSDAPAVTADDKGKGKEVDVGGSLQGPSGPAPLMGQNSATTQNPPILTPEEKRQRTGKHERGWRMFAQKVSGPFSTKKDTALQDIVKAQPRPRLELNLFDRHALGSFVLNEGQMDEQSLRSLGVYLDGDKERERRKDKDRKKHKHKQELLKAQAAASSSQSQPPSGPSPVPQVRTPGPVHPTTQNITKQSQQPQVNGTPNGHVNQHPTHLPNGQPHSVGKPSANGLISSNLKAGKVRKERDELTGFAPHGNSQTALHNVAGSPGQGPPRPHKKRKTDGPPGHALSPHPHQIQHAPSQPMQQATPTF